MAELRVNNLKKSFGQNEVLKGVSFHLETGKFLSLLGPSGCGKTTILRIICGLETPSSGEVLVDGSDITNVKPEKRNIGLVFQNYALFPSMTVAKNVGYGLKMQKVPQKEIDERVEDALELVKLPGYGPRKITQMSGGQQQRVALARMSPCPLWTVRSAARCSMKSATFSRRSAPPPCSLPTIRRRR